MLLNASIHATGIFLTCHPSLAIFPIRKYSATSAPSSFCNNVHHNTITLNPYRNVVVDFSFIVSNWVIKYCYSSTRGCERIEGRGMQ